MGLPRMWTGGNLQLVRECKRAVTIVTGLNGEVGPPALSAGIRAWGDWSSRRHQRGPWLGVVVSGWTMS